MGGSQRLLVAGGIAGTGASPQATRSVLAFDGETWETLPVQMEHAVSHAAVATRGDQLWVLGGLTQAGQLSNAVQVFDASEGSWKTLDWTLPFPSSLASAAFFGDALYVTAGMEDWGGSGGPNWTVYRITPETGAMEYTGQRLSYSRYGAATAIADGKLFVFSGIDDYGDLIHSVEVFDPVKGTVYGTAPIPTPRFGATAWVSGSKIVVIGGVGRNGKAMGTIEAFDLATNRWEAHAPLRTPRGYLAGGFLDGAFVAAGGHDGFHTSVSTSVSPFDVVESLAQ
jgi:N-acetylneuraminic acid mutarotase